MSDWADEEARAVCAAQQGTICDDVPDDMAALAAALRAAEARGIERAAEEIDGSSEAYGSVFAEAIRALITQEPANG